MREISDIKFRAWDLEAKEMSHFGLIELACCDLYLFKPTEYPDSPFKPQTGKLVEVMQFTGLLDKRGKEIYEGDILGQEQFLPWGIKWDKAGFYAYNLHNPFALYPLESATNREVIGNIYENPELLTKEDS